MQHDLHDELGEFRVKVEDYLIEAKTDDGHRDYEVIMKDVDKAKKYKHSLVDLKNYILEYVRNSCLIPVY